ncbi:MAG: type II secretion system protein [Candidatus Altimarinota bacterium]
MKLQNKKGFTLIELLVVITIIGILATGATGVYTSQIQKARDTTRINDITALRSGIEQVYGDKGAYPNGGAASASLPSFLDVKSYTSKIPADPKTGQKSTTSNFDYTYGVAADSNGIKGQAFEVSAHFENVGNLTDKAAKDGGSEDTRLEFGISLNTIGTQFNNATVPNSWVTTASISNSCIAALTGSGASGTAVACGTTESGTPTNPQTLIIR